jgi:hypothetical protein
MKRLNVSRGTKTQRVELGLALLSIVCRPGVPLTHRDIAAWCGCHWNAIFQIEQNALKKLSNLRFRNPALWDELAGAFFDRRQPATRPNETTRAERMTA